MISTFKSTNADTICLIPPAHQDKFPITRELVMAAKKANIPNVLCITSTESDFSDVGLAAQVEGVCRD